MQPGLGELSPADPCDHGAIGVRVVERLRAGIDNNGEVGASISEQAGVWRGQELQRRTGLQRGRGAANRNKLPGQRQ